MHRKNPRKEQRNRVVYNSRSIVVARPAGHHVESDLIQRETTLGHANADGVLARFQSGLHDTGMAFLRNQ